MIKIKPKHLSTKIPQDHYEELHAILPHHGGVSHLIRVAVKEFLMRYRKRMSGDIETTKCPHCKGEVNVSDS